MKIEVRQRICGGGASSIPLVGAGAEFAVRNVRLSAVLVTDSLPFVCILAPHADVCWGESVYRNGVMERNHTWPALLHLLFLLPLLLSAPPPVETSQDPVTLLGIIIYGKWDSCGTQKKNANNKAT